MTRAGLARYAALAEQESHYWPMEEAMSDIESRLKVLEERARNDDERWQMQDDLTKAYRLILTAIGAPICAANRSLFPIIIKNLKGYEDEARLQNRHATMIQELLYAREFFESRSSNNFDHGPQPT